MNAISNHFTYALRRDFTKRKGESMQYLAAIVCVIALVLINIFGTESKDINAILSGAIMALVWGGVQRATTDKRNDSGSDGADAPKRKTPAQRRGNLD